MLCHTVDFGHSTINFFGDNDLLVDDIVLTICCFLHKFIHIRKHEIICS